MPSAEPPSLTFNAKRSRHIDVEDKSGAEVAALEIGWTGLSFQTRHADGSTMRAATEWWAVPRAWRAYRLDGPSHLSVQKRLFENAGLVQLADGHELMIRGVASRRGVDVAEPGGTRVLHFAEKKSWKGSWTATLTLWPSEASPSVLDAVCLVQMWRMLVPRSSSDPSNTADISAATNTTYL
jgi:hypothetical protein